MYLYGSTAVVVHNQTIYIQDAWFVDIPQMAWKVTLDWYKTDSTNWEEDLQIKIFLHLNRDCLWTLAAVLFSSH